MKMMFLRSLLPGILIVCGVAEATPKFHTNHPRDHADQTCDYIVVGGGTAGKYELRGLRAAH
jgi:hypothetical protein